MGEIFYINFLSFYFLAETLKQLENRFLQCNYLSYDNGMK
jgi:hypothetical protein